MDIKQPLKSSIEARWRKHQFFFYLSLYLFLLFVIVIAVLISMSLPGNHDYAFPLTFTMTDVYSLIFLPFVIYSLIKYVNTFANSDQYKVYEVTLDSPITSYFYRGAVYYQVTFEIEGNIRVTKDTKPLWSDLLFSPNKLSDYNNKKVKIAYNKEIDQLIVIGWRSSLYCSNDLKHLLEPLTSIYP